MAPRKYNKEKRAASAAETRQRIVEATYSLHNEKGVVATSFRDIAERAQVGIGTVYHHFPTYEQVIEACGELTMSIVRPPTSEIFVGLSGRNEKIRRLVQELFACYERYPSYERVRVERDEFPVLAAKLGLFDRQLKNLLREALNLPDTGENYEGQVCTLFALTDFAVYRALTKCGLSTEEAATRTAEVLLAWLGTQNIR